MRSMAFVRRCKRPRLEQNRCSRIGICYVVDLDLDLEQIKHA
jgi:hypothetical protein